MLSFIYKSNSFIFLQFLDHHPSSRSRLHLILPPLHHHFQFFLILSPNTKLTACSIRHQNIFGPHIGSEVYNLTFCIQKLPRK